MSIVEQLRGDWYLVIGDEPLAQGETAVLSLDGLHATISDQPGARLTVRPGDGALSIQVTRTMLVVVKAPADDEPLTAQANVFWTIPGDAEEMIEAATLVRFRGDAANVGEAGRMVAPA